MRSCFRDWTDDHGHPSDVAELSLAHTIGSQVERSYRRSDLFERRRALMDAWSDFVTKPPAVVVPLPLRRMGG